MLAWHVEHNHLPWGTLDCLMHCRWNHTVLQDLLSQATMSPPLLSLQQHHEPSTSSLCKDRSLSVCNSLWVYHFPRSSSTVGCRVRSMTFSWKSWPNQSFIQCDPFKHVTLFWSKPQSHKSYVLRQTFVVGIDNSMCDHASVDACYQCLSK